MPCWLHQAWCIISKWIQTGVTIGNAQFRMTYQNWWFLSRVTLKFDRWPLKSNRAPLLCYFKLWASFRSHLWIQTGVTVRKHPSQIKISDFLSHVTFKFDGWPWKRIGQLLYITSSFVHHFIAISEFMKLQSGNTQFGSKSVIFCPVRSWNLTDDL